jgi:hypothetical protein
MVNKGNMELMEQVAPGMGDLNKWTPEGLNSYGLENDSPVHKLVEKVAEQVLVAGCLSPGKLGHVLEGALGVMYVLGRASVLNRQ